MSSRRLVNRGDEGHRSRQRESEATARPTPLPPYDPPSCALTPAAKQQLADLHNQHDYTKYKKHLEASMKALTNGVGDSNERLRLRKEKLDKAREKRTRNGEEEEDNGQKNTEEEYYSGMKVNVSSLTAKADKALRELIDYGDEMAMKESIMREVSENVAAATPRSTRRQRRQGSDANENEEPQNAEEGDEEDVVVSALDILKKAKENYAATYATKNERARYDTNEYRGFRSTIHVATHGPNVPIPHARTWFEDTDNAAAKRRRRQDADDDSDDEVVIASATLKTKCPLTLREFTEPYQSETCKHVFEKSAIVEYITLHGTEFMDNTQSDRRRGAKQVKCPEVGCEAMLQLDGFRIDDVLLRQMLQAKKQAAREAQEEEEDEEPVPRGSQRNRPADVDEDDSIDVDELEDPRAAISNIKRERQQSGGRSVVSSS